MPYTARRQPVHSPVHATAQRLSLPKSILLRSPPTHPCIVPSRYDVMLASGATTWHVWLYFLLAVAIGGFFIINLFLGVVFDEVRPLTPYHL